MLKKLSIIAFIFLISCKSNPSNNLETVFYTPEISVSKNKTTIEILLYDYPDISGFQFDLVKNGDIDITSINASLGLAEEHGFYITTSIHNLRVLGISLTEAAIPALSLDSNILITLQLEYSEGSGELGIENVILSGENGYEIETITNPATIIIP